MVRDRGVLLVSGPWWWCFEADLGMIALLLMVMMLGRVEARCLRFRRGRSLCGFLLGLSLLSSLWW